MKRFFLAAAVLAGLCLVPAAARAQTGTARGKVVDEQGQGLADVKIDIEFRGGVTRKLETKTNKKGEFTQVGLHPGIYKFTASKEGYQGGYLETKINLGDPTYLPDLKITKPAPGAGGLGGAAFGELKASVDKAIELTKAGKLDEAEVLYKDAITKSPQYAVLHYNLAIVYMMKNNAAAAEAEYLKAIELQPEQSDAYAGITNLYLATGKADKALEIVNKAAAERPDDAKLQLQLGVIHFNTGKPDEAATAIKKAGSLDPSLAEVHFYLGSIAVGQGKTDECIAELEKYLASSPTNQQNIQTAQGLLSALKKK